MKKVKNTICIVFGHSWKYNFSSIPNKRICQNCKMREGLNLKTLEWTEKFEDERSDIELINDWSDEK